MSPLDAESGQEDQRDIVFRGVGVSNGIIYGKVFVLDRKDPAIPREQIADDAREQEIQRLHEAIEKTEADLGEMRRKIERRVGKDHAMIFDAHLLMVRDARLIAETEQRIYEENVNAEYAVMETVNAFVKVFEGIEDTYLRGRIADVKDVCRRLLQHLMGERTTHVPREGEAVIVVARDLSPSDTAQMHKEVVLGFCTDVGSRVSHTAIMARALGIPAVVGLGRLSDSLTTGDMILLDGNRGTVLVNPCEERISQFMADARRFEVLLKKLREEVELPAVTKDGHRLRIGANIELTDELKQIHRHGGEGIGLYRTEYFYMGREDLPTENEHYMAYMAAAKCAAPHPVIIRTCDLGGDKFASMMEVAQEVTDCMGWRAIRFSLQMPDMFKTQLAGILRAATVGEVKVMFPMISGIEELRRAKEVLEEVKDDLRRKGEDFKMDIDVGAMIEVPSAAITADLVAKEVDFFSIGTNDLIQYTLAVNRVNEKIAHLYDPAHPAILRLLRDVTKAAHDNGIWVGMCGEMAGDPFFCPILLGLGLDGLSMAPVVIPEIKRVVRACHYDECVDMVGHTMDMLTGSDVRKFIKRRMGEIFPDLQ